MSTWISSAWRRARGVFSGLASVFFLTVASAGSQELQLDPHQQLAHDLFRELIEINTVESEGTAPAAEAMARRLLDAGFPPEDVHIVGPDDRNVQSERSASTTSRCARRRMGARPRSHPSRGRGWSAPPFRP